MKSCNCQSQEKNLICGDFKPLTYQEEEIFCVAVENLVGAKYNPLFVLCKRGYDSVHYYYIANQLILGCNPSTDLVLVTVNVKYCGEVTLMSISPVELCVKPLRPEYECNYYNSKKCSKRAH